MTQVERHEIATKIVEEHQGNLECWEEEADRIHLLLLIIDALETAEIRGTEKKRKCLACANPEHYYHSSENPCPENPHRRRQP